MKDKITMKIFDTDVYLQYKADVSRVIRILENIKDEIKDFTIKYGLDFEFKTGYEDVYYHIGSACVNWILNQNNLQDIKQSFLECSVINEKWAMTHYEMPHSKRYYKITFLPEIRDNVLAEISKYIPELQKTREKIAEIEKMEEEERNRTKDDWRVTKVYKNVKARGEGVDGYYDAEYISKDGENVRMVSKDIFDVGTFSYPKRFERTDGVINRDQWTDAEKRVDEWIRYFGVLSGKELRM